MDGGAHSTKIVVWPMLWSQSAVESTQGDDQNGCCGHQHDTESSPRQTGGRSVIVRAASCTDDLDGQTASTECC